MLCITVKDLRILSRGKTRKPITCDRRPILGVANLNRNLTRFMPSKIQYHARIGSLDMRQQENVKNLSRVCFER